MSNPVPEGWSFGRFDEFAEVNPRLHQKSELNEDTEVSFIKMEDVSNGARVVNMRVRQYGEVAKGFTSFTDNDVLVAKITPCFENGKGGFASGLRNGVGFGSTEFHVVRSTGKSDPAYLYQYTNYTGFRLPAEANMVGSAGQRRVPTDFIKSHHVPFPPLPEQQKIAAILTSVDNVIESTQAQINKLQDLKAGMMQELLTRGIGHSEFKDSPVGRIPEGWEVLTMRDVCTTRQGLQIPISNRHTAPGENRYVYLTVKFINSGFDQSVAEYIENPNERVVCKEDDIVLARTGATGKVVTGVNGVFHNNFFMVDYDRAKAAKDFLVQYLNSPYIQTEIKNRAGTTTIPDLNHGDFYSLPMLIPSMDEQLKIADVLNSLDSNLRTKRERLLSLQHTKKALMQDLLTGKVRVKTD